MLLNTRGGMLGSKIFIHNLFNKNINDFNFRYFDDFDELPRIDENPIYNNSAIDRLKIDRQKIRRYNYIEK